MARSDYAYYPKLWQKSFLIEIIRKDSRALIKSFALSLPPESVQIEVPQRVNVTKTFGGLFVDDYGVDSTQINISGSTGNTQAKQVFSSGAMAYLTGKNESYFILEEIMQYKRGTQDYDKYELRIYDLSSVNGSRLSVLPGAVNAGVVLESMNVDGWTVVLKEGKISRAKDKPFWYNYSFNFIGIEPIGTKHYRFDVSYNQPAIENIFNEIANLKNYASGLKKLLSSYKDIVNKVKLVEEATDNLEAGVREYYKTAQGFVNVTIDGVNSVIDIVKFPMDLTEDLMAAVTNLRDSVENGYSDIAANWGDVTTKATNTQEMFNDLVGIEDSSSQVRANAKSMGALPDVMITPLEAPGSTRAINASDPNVDPGVSYLLTYGSFQVEATSETRLDVLSMQAYGTPDYADMLAAYNGILGDTEITPGMRLSVPYLSYTPALRDNEVYDINQDIYGSDIALSDGGDLVLAEFNDFAVVSGTANVEQAIDLRLSESDGARVRLTTYGITVEGGGFDALSMAVLVSSIKETLLQDPRVNSVFNFGLDAQGDAVAITFDVQLESGGKAQFRMNL